ncbi:hypothetical protein DV515_00019706, partial [Chloebia gouldiae]
DGESEGAEGAVALKGRAVGQPRAMVALRPRAWRVWGDGKGAEETEGGWGFAESTAGLRGWRGWQGAQRAPGLQLCRPWNQFQSLRLPRGERRSCRPAARAGIGELLLPPGESPGRVGLRVVGLRPRALPGGAGAGPAPAPAGTGAVLGQGSSVPAVPGCRGCGTIPPRLRSPWPGPLGCFFLLTLLGRLWDLLFPDGSATAAKGNVPVLTQCSLCLPAVPSAVPVQESRSAREEEPEGEALEMGQLGSLYLEFCLG